MGKQTVSTREHNPGARQAVIAEAVERHRRRKLCVWLAVAGMAFAIHIGPCRALQQATQTRATAESTSRLGDQAVVPDPLTVNGRAVGHRVESRDGEICVICGKPISKDDVTYMVDGQRVPVHKGACLGALAARPVEWLSKLKPRGAFLDASAAQLGLSAGWLLLGLFVLAGLLFGALAAHRAFSVGRDPLLWLAVGFVTNVFGYAVLIALPRQELHAVAGVPAGLGKVAATYAPVACPACGAENHPSARVCSGCGGALTPRIVSEAQKARLVS